MSMMIKRRGMLAAVLGSAAIAVSDVGARAQPATAIQLVAHRRTIEVNGKPATVFALHQLDGTSGVSLLPGQRFTVDLVNKAGEPTIIHWHGQTPPVRQDGVTQTRLEPLIMPDTSQAYDYVPRSGTYWMHSHHGLQEQRLMAAPLIVHTADDLRADAQDVVVMLHDFTFRDPSEILAALMKDGAMGGDAASKTTMPMGSQPAGIKMGDQMQGMTMPGHTAMPAMPMPNTGSSGKTGMVMDLNDVDFDAYLANGRTLADPQVVRTERGGLVRLRLINGASSTAFWIGLGGAAGAVVAVDGDPIRPITVHRFPMAEAQRVDVLLRMPAGGSLPILAQREGGRERTGIILGPPRASIAKIGAEAERAAGPVDLSLESRLQAMHALPRRPADIRHRVTLTGSMMPYRWGIDALSWPNHKPLTVTHGQRVELELVNQTSMAHPMHLHGHHFQVIALNGRLFAGAVRDTVLVPAGGTVRVAFDADNPGRWLFHCHNLYHMEAGMMTEVAYADFW